MDGYTCLMKRCAFLTMDDLGSHVNDDELAIDVLKQQQWSVHSISWRKREVDWSIFDIVVIRSPWDYYEHPSLFIEALERIDASGTRLENSLDIVRWNIDKRYLMDLQKRGVHVVPTVFGSKLDDETFSELADSFGHEPFIIKPIISASAKNTFCVTPHTMQRAQIVSTFRSEDYMVQPFMHQIVEHGEFSLFYFNNTYSHCIRKLPQKNDFRVQEEHGGLIKAYSPDTRLLETAQHVLKTVDQSVLYARIDLVQDDSGDYALMELELIEPSLYFRMDPKAPLQFATALNDLLTT